MSLVNGLSQHSWEGEELYAYKLSENEHLGLVSLPWGTVQDISKFMDVVTDKNGNTIKINAVLNCHYFDMVGGTNGFLGRCQSFTYNGTTTGVGEDGFTGWKGGTDKPYTDLVVLHDGTIKYGDFNSWDYTDVMIGVAPAGVELDEGEDKTWYSPACGWGKITTSNTQSLLIKCDDRRFALVAVTGSLSPNTCRDWTKSIGGVHQSCYDSGGSTQMVVRNTDDSLNTIRNTGRAIPTAFVAYEIVKTKPITYSINYNLVNATSSNTSTSIGEGEAFTTNITANTGYELYSVKVTMNDVDISSDVYSNGVISISSVTGDVAIKVNTKLSDSGTDTPTTPTTPGTTTDFSGMAIAELITHYNTSASAVETEKQLQKTALTNLGVDMSNLPFTNYHEKFGDIWTSEQTGCFVPTMFSDSQDGFTASKNGWASDTKAAYTLFDGNDNTVIFSNNPNGQASNQPEEPNVILMFPKTIRIAELVTEFGYGAEAVTYSRWFHVFGIKEDGTEVDLAYNNSGDTWSSAPNSKQTHTVSAENKLIPFVGIKVKRTSGGSGWYYLRILRITKWYEKVSAVSTQSESDTTEISAQTVTSDMTLSEMIEVCSNNVLAVETEKQLQKTVLTSLGMDMTDVPFTSYHEKINSVSGNYDLIAKVLNPESGSYNDSGYTPGQYAVYTIPDGYKITDVDCEASVYVHGDNTNATLSATIEVSNNNSTWTKLKTTNSTGTTTKNYQLIHNISYTFGAEGCTYKYIRCGSTGNSFKRIAKGVFKGFKTSTQGGN